MGEPETGEQRPETGKWNALREREPRKTQRGRDATKRHLKRKDAKTQRSGRIHEERKKAGKDLLAEPLFLPSCFPHSIPPSLWPPEESTRNAMNLKVGTVGRKLHGDRSLLPFLLSALRAIIRCASGERATIPGRRGRRRRWRGTARSASLQGSRRGAGKDGAFRPAAHPGRADRTRRHRRY